MFFELSGFQITKNHLVEVIPSLAPAWYVSFEVFPQGVVNGWSNIIHFTIGGCNGKHGRRTPAVWFNSQTTKLTICSTINSNVNRCFTSKSLQRHQYTKVEIIQKQISTSKYRYSILIAGKRVFHTVNSRARYHQNVKVYRSNPWVPAAKALIKNLVYRNLYHGKF